MIGRRCRHKAAARNRARYRQVADRMVLRADHNTLARRGRAYKGRTVPDRQRCDWHRGWRQNGHPRQRAWRRRENRARARRKSCPHAKAARAVGNRPLLACEGSHRAVQNRAAASAAAMVKGLVRTGQSLRRPTARKTRTRSRIVSAPPTPSPSQLPAAAGEMSLKLGRPLGAGHLAAAREALGGTSFGYTSIGRSSCLAQRSTKRSMSSSMVANEVTSRMRTLSAPVSKLSLLRT